MRLPFKRKKKFGLKAKLITIGIITLVISLFGLYIYNVILPMYLLTSATATIVMNEDLLDTSQNTYNPPLRGNAIPLSGGLTNMGIDFETTISELIEQYKTETDDTKKKEAAGKLAYAQLYQLLDAETELSGHPTLLLGTAMGIREMSIFNSNYSSFVNKLKGDDLTLGIYGTWCDSCINGLPNKGGGVITHGMSLATTITSSLDSPIGTFKLADYSVKSFQDIATSQKYSSVIRESDNFAYGYNKGAYGPVQIEANHWITWVCPYVSSDSKFNGYTPGNGYYNIPMDVTKFDNLYSALIDPVTVNGKKQPVSVVTAKNHHLALYAQNQTFVDNLLATVGHSDYLAVYANLVNNTDIGKSTFGVDEYYFKGRFTDSTKEWEDYVMSLEAWPNAFTCFAIDRIGLYPMYENIGEIKNQAGEAVKGFAFDERVKSVFGDSFTFENDIAKNIYWTLEMMQSWNYGAPCTDYSKTENSHLHDIAWLYRELANYISKFGTEAIRADDSLNPVSACTECDYKVSHYSGIGQADSCTKYQAEVYKNLTKMLCEANGTSDDIQTKIINAINKHQTMKHHKNNYAYAITGVLDAEANSQVIMRDIFGIENFNIFNYGA